MTNEEAIARIREHKIIHKMNEPRAIYISEALDMAIKALEQEPCDDDCISREDVLTNLRLNWRLYESAEDAIKRSIYDVSNMDSIYPERAKAKTGHWIEKDDFDGDVHYDCSECGESFCLIDGTPTDNLYNYCPICGAKMVEPQESEEEDDRD